MISTIAAIKAQASVFSATRIFKNILFISLQSIRNNCRENYITLNLYRQTDILL